MVASETRNVQWEVESDHLDWWAQSTEVSCELQMNGIAWNGTPLAPSTVSRDTTVNSWSPGVTISFIAVLVLLVASVGLLRLVGQNDKFRLAAIYSGVLALGFAFHLMGLVSSDWGGPAILFIAALWVWIMTWKSTVEFQLIHEDYQRARKGISTLYSDHFDVLSNSKPPIDYPCNANFRYDRCYLRIPSSNESDSANMFSLVSYLIIVVVGVTFLIWYANRMYGSLYGRLTEVEVQASRIERDLGDPARLLTELASDGLDISSIISQPRSTAAAALGNAPESIVIDWDEDVGVLMDEDEATPESLDIMGAPEEIEAPEDSIPLEEASEEESQPMMEGIDVEDLFSDEEVGIDD